MKSTQRRSSYQVGLRKHFVNIRLVFYFWCFFSKSLRRCIGVKLLFHRLSLFNVTYHRKLLVISARIHTLHVESKTKTC